MEVGYQWTVSKHPDGKVHGAHLGPTWGRQDPGGPHVGPMSLAIWEITQPTNFGEMWIKLKISFKLLAI